MPIRVPFRGRLTAKAGERSLDLLRWGLIPYWATDLKVGFANINAKAEGIESKPAFREAFQRRRCLVPVDNFYEWVERQATLRDCARGSPVLRGKQDEKSASISMRECRRIRGGRRA
jgi:putative SOS response-associated peptidase YedK